MSNFNEAPASRNADLQALEQQLSKALGKEKAPPPSASTASGSVARSLEITVKDGKETLIDRTKPLGGNTATAVSPTRPGHVKIEGQGEFPIKAAIAAGLLPEGWTPERGFEQPAGKQAGNLAGQQNATRSDTEEAPEEDPDVTPAMKAAVDAAGKILVQVDQIHGADVTDRYLSEAATTGEIPTEGLPEGVSADAAQQIYAGFVAQCEATLSEVGASVALLEEMLDDDHLRAARQATIRHDAGTLREIGQLASQRLARLPEKNPEAFAALVADMAPAERDCLHHENGRWTVRIPGKPEMSFAAAVKQRLVRF
ncbi:hypothetical protein [Paracoccus sp. N5]|uniref:hypothetical protein n=1 Tax=Paracoccus sp. N5 TaxID=1101189 RepID=UPI000366F489|nr:hypothetical protein [Paracoccus sp. N5]